MFARGPKWNSESLQNLGGVILAVLNKLHGNDGSEPIREHFNRVMRESKAFCKDPRNSIGFEPESRRLACYMSANEDLKKIFMEIDSIDDVDMEIANRILRILEPKYARSEPIEKLAV